MQALLDNQINAIDKLNAFKVGALLMEPGTGKSRATIELIRSVKDIGYILWLAPFRSINPKVKGSGIKEEVAKWGDFNCEIEFIGIETLSSSDKTYLRLTDKLKKNTRAFIVVDESLKIKNWEASRTKRIIELGKLVEYKLILNGTPLSRNLLDIWAQMEFLSPKIFNMGIAEFKSTFCETVKITKRSNGRAHVKEFIAKYHNVDHLYSLIKNYVFEADLELLIGRQYFDLSYSLDEPMKDEYNELKEKYLDNEKLAFLNNNIFLEMTMKMQHVYSCSEDKFKKVAEIIKEHGEDKIIIYCKFIISQEECRKRFPNIIVLSIQSEVMSLNLQSKSVTIYFDKTWDYASVKQGSHRTYRTGQTEVCYYYDLTGNVGLETMMSDNLKKKSELLTYFKNLSINELKKLL